MRVFTNDTDTVIAVDLDGALKVLDEHHGGSFLDATGMTRKEIDGDFYACAHDAPIPIRLEFDREPYERRVTHTAEEWVAIHGRPMFLCSTEC